jgi:bla regulator protein BlaR1
MSIHFLPSAGDILARALITHLEQSTLFAVAAGSLALVLRDNRAHTRYWIWSVASVKFLIPFSLLVDLGGHLGWSFAPARSSSLGGILETTVLSSTSATGAAAGPAHASIASWVPSALLICWLVGFASVLISWCVAWRRVRAAVKVSIVIDEGWEYRTLLRLQQLTGIRTPVQLAYSPSPLEPGVYGVRRPRLLLPIGIRDFLSREHMEALLAHELTHIRRRDNLLAAIHMFVQAVFWFHPLVWWLGARLLEERERACDEEVLRLGNEPHIYAESILRVCKFCVTSPVPCVAGVTGSDLKRRVQEIMTRHLGRKLNRAQKALLAMAGFAALAAPVVVGMMEAPRLRAQSPVIASATKPKFDVATIKPSDADTRMMVQFAPGGRVAISHATLRFLIKIAYDIGDQQIEGGPDWVNSKRFDVEAKPDSPLGGDMRNMTEDQRRLYREQIRLRLQSLLADRFKLTLLVEEKQMPIYALVVGKNGPKLQQAPDGPGGNLRGGRGELSAANIGMEGFARFLGEQAGRPVVDMTGLKGNYNFDLKWSPDSGPTSDAPDAINTQPAPAESSGPTLFAAVQEQLGLKLEARKSPNQLMVVEKAELPSEN